MIMNYTQGNIVVSNMHPALKNTAAIAPSEELLTH